MKAKKSENIIIKLLTRVFILCFIFSLVLFTFLMDFRNIAWRSDLVSFVTGAKIIRSGEGKNIYDLDTQQKYQSEITFPNKLIMLPFRNLPVYGLFFIPFTYLHISSAYKIYTLIIVITTILISWLSTKFFDNLKKTYWFILPFVFYPGLMAIFSGQNSTFLILGFMLIYYFIKMKKPLIVGILTGFLFLKFHYIVAFPYIYFLINNKHQFIKGFLASSAIIFLASVYISGPGFLGRYLQMLIATENPTYGTRPTSLFSLFSALSQFTAFSKSNVLLINVILYLLSISYFYKNAKKFTLQINFAILMLLTLVFCIHGGNHDMALLILPLWLFLDYYKGRKKYYLEYILVIFIVIFSYVFFGIGLSHVIPFLFLLSVALLYRIIKFPKFYL